LINLRRRFTTLRVPKIHPPSSGGMPVVDGVQATPNMLGVMLPVATRSDHHVCSVFARQP
jgi:hypothetical protein